MFHVLDAVLSSGVRFDGEHFQFALLEHALCRHQTEIERLTKGAQTQISGRLDVVRLWQRFDVPRFRSFVLPIFGGGAVVQRVARVARVDATPAHVMDGDNFVFRYWKTRNTKLSTC